MSTTMGENGDVPDVAHTEEENGRPVKLLSTPEGRILILAMILALLYVLWLGSSLVWSPDKFQVFVGMTGTHIMAGRAAGMSFGYALGFGHKVVVPINLAVEGIMVLLFYPLFVFSLRKLLVINTLKDFIDSIHSAAGRNYLAIRRYGIPGLFAFVCFPFWLTGPLVGCVIGYLMGLKTWVNMTVVLTGTLLASICWAVFLLEVHERVATYSPYAPFILLVVIIAVAVVGCLLYKAGGSKRAGGN